MCESTFKQMILSSVYLFKEWEFYREDECVITKASTSFRNTL